jgi:hypothetical protein
LCNFLHSPVTSSLLGPTNPDTVQKRYISKCLVTNVMKIRPRLLSRKRTSPIIPGFFLQIISFQRLWQDIRIYCHFACSHHALADSSSKIKLTGYSGNTITNVYPFKVI